MLSRWYVEIALCGKGLPQSAGIAAGKKGRGNRRLNCSLLPPAISSFSSLPLPPRALLPRPLAFASNPRFLRGDARTECSLERSESQNEKFFLKTASRRPLEQLLRRRRLRRWLAAPSPPPPLDPLLSLPLLLLLLPLLLAALPPLSSPAPSQSPPPPPQPPSAATPPSFPPRTSPQPLPRARARAAAAAARPMQPSGRRRPTRRTLACASTCR